MKQYILATIGALLLCTPTFMRASSPILKIKNTHELEQLLKREKNIVIKFSTENCPYCVYLDPHFQAAVNAYNGPVVFASVMIPSDTATRNWYKKTFEFATVPTVVYYRDGQKMHVHGSDNKAITNLHILNNINRVYSI